VGEKISAGCGLYGTGGCGEHGWTERSCWARLLAALALAPFGAAPLVARSKPNFHRNNDRKSECELQGCVHCGLSRFLHAGQVKTSTLHNSKSAAPGKAKPSARKG